ncbi:hypothetical protein [Natrinema ejinorense]|uniref:Uncharacterized protein n=1 Tax=Natrinema ejinorense TaxID=373386 RepID=A0A2A5QRQ4_9EURY|nr:hypothetical protein [Natrinema ejinorense]PCR89443.1 hypothetical protein CP557_02155 [Natrinema ejinorense]
MTWSGVFFATIAIATLFTVIYGVLEEAVVFSTAIATTTWLLLAFIPEVVVISNGSKVPVQIGPIRWIFTGLALLSAIALIGALLGVFPAEPDIDTQRDSIS